ncbi:hypothetical protein [Kocuria aegyptia]|uniref:Uncharacterized protein n=1 Tax=Kocuria aegyptia TaxID=330943 RepID=A0ABN2K895_9MICC
MATPHDYGFEFQDATGLTDEDFQKLMATEPQKYPEHLQIALSLERWVDSVKGRLASGEVNSMDHKRLEGLRVALPEVAAALREGQFLPGRQFRGLTDAQVEDAERAADTKLRAAFEEGFNG